LFAAVFVAGLILLFVIQAMAPAHGLRGRYYSNETWTDPAVSTSVEPIISSEKNTLIASGEIPERFSAVWEGFIFAPRKGTYRFSISSDDGSWVTVDDAVVIDNGGVHPASIKGKDVVLAKGNHRLLIRYFNGGGQGVVEFDWRGLGPAGRGIFRSYLYPKPVSFGLVLLDAALPVLSVVLTAICVLAAIGFLAGAAVAIQSFFSKCPLPRALSLDAAVLAGSLIFLLVIPAIAPSRGLRGQFFANLDWTGPPVSTSLDPAVSFWTDFIQNRTKGAEKSSALWEGHIYAPENGMYRFSVRSDDGSWIEVDDVLVVNNGGIHPALYKAERDVSLSKGDHRLRIKYFDAGGASRLDFSWRRTGSFGLFRPRLFLYPGPVGFGRIIFDSALSVLILFLKAVCVLAGLAFIGLFLPMAAERALRPHGEKSRSWPDVLLQRARRRTLLLTAILAGSALLLAAIRLFSPVHGLQARYFGNRNWEGPPAITAIDPAVRFESEDEIVVRMKSTDQFSVIWEGTIFAPRSSTYRFSIGSDDGAWVFLDDAVLIDIGSAGPWREAERDIELARGNHKILIKYFDAGGAARIEFRWAENKTPKVFLPRLHFYPAPVSRGFVIWDTVLGYASILTKIAFIVTSLLLLLALSREIYRRYLDRVPQATAIEETVVARIERFLAAARTRIVLVIAVFAVLLVLFLASTWISSARGLTGRYFDNPDWTGAPMTTSVDRSVFFYEDVLRKRAVVSESFGVLWEGFIYVPRTSDYILTLITKGNASLHVDGTSQIEIDHGRPSPEVEREIALSKGNHRLLIKYGAFPEAEAVRFLWKAAPAVKDSRPRPRLYVKPVSVAFFVLDTVIQPLALPIKILFAASALFLLILAVTFVRPKWNLLSIVLLFLFFGMAVSYEALVLARKSTAVEGCDSYAYLQGAERMARSGFLKTEFIDPLIPEIARSFEEKPQDNQLVFLLSPHGYYVHDYQRGTVYNVFPPGTSLLLYPFILVGGRPLAFYILPLLNVVLLLLFFYFGSKYVGIAFGLTFSAVTMFNVHIFVNTFYIMSDVPSMALLAFAAFCLFRQLKKPRFLWPFLAGVCFGFAFVVRYSNLAGALPLAYLLWLRFRSERRWRTLLKDGSSFAAGAFLFGFLPMGLYTHRLLGTAFRLVYEPITQSRTEWKSLGRGLHFYAESLLSTFGIPGLAMMALGLAACFARRKYRTVAVTCFLAFLGIFVFYSLQSITHDRYLIPAYPFLGVLAGFGLLEITRLFDRSLVLRLGLILLFVGFAFFFTRGRYAGGTEDDEIAALSSGNRIPPNAVVFCDRMSGPVRLYLDLPGYRFTWTNDQTLKAVLDFLSAKGYPIYFYLDGPPAQNRFASLIEHDIIPKSGLELISRILKWPLYRVRLKVEGGKEESPSAGRPR